MKLTDLNLDCLETVLEYLEFEDLFNAANSNKRMQRAASPVYDRKYYKRFELGVNGWFGGPKYEILRGCIYVFDFKYGLQLLRCFGHLLSSIDYNDQATKYYNNEQDRCYIEYIYKFCAETLKTFVIEGHCINIGNKFTKPFNWIERVVIKQKRFGSHFRTDLLPSEDFLGRMFPRMPHLYLDVECLWFWHSESIVNHFPYLKNLVIQINGKCNQCECTNKIVSILRSNPQLKCIQLYQFREKDVHIFQTMNEYNRNLTKFWIDVGLPFFTEYNNGTIWHLKHVKWLNADAEINLGGSFPYKIPFSFDQLETLCIALLNPFTDHFYQFCAKNPSIKKLLIRCRHETYPLVIDDYSNITKSIPSLEELEFLGILMDMAIEIIGTFSNHKPLKTVKFRLFDRRIHPSMSYLNERLPNGWSIFSIEKIHEYKLITVKCTHS